MINIRKRGKVYQYQFEIAKIGNKRKSITKSGFTTKNEAYLAGMQAYEKYINGGANKESQMSYADYLDYWMKEYFSINYKYSTIKRYSETFETIKREIGKCKLCALTWEDIDFENKVINFKHSVFDKKKNENGRWYIGTTKTKSGERQIHISPTLMKALVNFKNKQTELKLLYGKDYKCYHFEEVKNQYGKVLEYQIVENQTNILSVKPANMVFIRNNGKYCGTDIIKYPYKIIHNELGIENCRFYDLRGSYATTILRNGVEIRDVADVLRHKDIETTENYYISSTDETRKNVTNSLKMQ